MFYRESCSAGSKESGGHGDGSRPSNLQVRIPAIVTTQFDRS